MEGLSRPLNWTCPVVRGPGAQRAAATPGGGHTADAASATRIATAPLLIGLMHGLTLKDPC